MSKEKSSAVETSGSTAAPAVRETKSEYRNFICIFAVILVGLLYNLNASSFAVLVESVAIEMIPKGMLPTQIGWLISIAALFMIPGVLLSSVLTSRVRMRTLLLWSWIIYGLAGTVIIWCQSTFGILAMRAVQGIALGLGQPASRALPGRLYGQDSRGRILGLLSMGGGAMSMVVSLIYGRVALVFGWRACMWVALIICCIIIITTLIWVPNLPVEKASKEEFVPKDQRRPFGLTFWAMLALGFISFAIGSVIQIETSTFVQTELGLGGADYASYVSISCTLGIVVAGIPFGKLFMKLGKWLVPISLFAAAVGYYWFAASTAMWSICLAGFFTNLFTIGTLFVYTVTRLQYAVPRERITAATTALMMAWFLGQTLATPWINWAQQMWGATATAPLYATAVAWAVICAISLIYIIATRKMPLTALEKYGRE